MASALVLVGGLLGVVAFFLPFVQAHEGRTTISASAYQIGRGVKEIKTPDLPRREVPARYGEVRPMVLAWFSHSLALLVIGVIVTARRRFGRGAGAISLLVGLLGTCMGGMLLSLEGPHWASGAIVLFASGIVGLVGGVIGLVKPAPHEAPSAAVTPGISA